MPESYQQLEARCNRYAVELARIKGENVMTASEVLRRINTELPRRVKILSPYVKEAQKELLDPVIKRTRRILKPYPKRIKTGELVYDIILKALRQETFKHNVNMPLGVAKNIAGYSTEQVIKLIQNNYRRRRKN